MRTSVQRLSFFQDVTAGRYTAAFVIMVGASALAAVWPVQTLVRRAEAAGTFGEAPVTLT